MVKNARGLMAKALHAEAARRGRPKDVNNSTKVRVLFIPAKGKRRLEWREK